MKLEKQSQLEGKFIRPFLETRATFELNYVRKIKTNSLIMLFGGSEIAFFVQKLAEFQDFHI